MVRTDPFGPGPDSPQRKTLPIFEFLKMAQVVVDRLFSVVIEP